MIVVGLGNPEQKYKNTRHNIGFMFLNRLLNGQKDYHKKNLKKSITFKNKTDTFVYPLTYMNLSGEAVLEIKNKYKVQPSDFLVVCDDISIPLGSIRIRKNGGTGGHNGLKSIVMLMNSIEFPRMRLGVGSDKIYDLADFVLSNFEKDEWVTVNSMLDKAVQSFYDIKNNGLEYAMKIYNTRSKN